MQILVQEYLKNLQLLGFKPPDSNFFHDMSLFNRANKALFESMVHYLFTMLDPTKSKSLFEHCFPCANHQRSQEFRTICVNWWKSISLQNPELNLPRVSGMMLKDPSGSTIVQMMYLFSAFVLKCETEKFSNGSCHILNVPPLCSSKLASIQTTASLSVTKSLYKELINEMQVAQREDLELQSFIEEHSKGYREANKKRKILTETMEKLLKHEPPKKWTPSKNRVVGREQRFSEHDFEMSRKKLEKALSLNRKMFSNLDKATNIMKSGQDIINHIITEQEEGKLTLDSSHMSVKVPAMLVKEHTSEVYEKIGTSLYNDGSLNLQSLVNLFNLSTSLVNDKLCTDGIKNFEGDLANARTQQHIQLKNLDDLKTLNKAIKILKPQIGKNLLQKTEEIKLQRLEELRLNDYKENIFLSPQKFPWQNNNNQMSFKSLNSSDIDGTPDVTPLLSLGLKTYKPNVKPPHVDWNSTAKPKLVVPMKTHHQSNINTRKLSDKKVIKKQPIHKNKPVLLTETKTPDKTVTPIKSKTASERAMSELADFVVASTMQTPASSLKNTKLKSTDNNESYHFDVKKELSSKPFEPKETMKRTPPTSFCLNETNDSVFETKPTKDKLLANTSEDTIIYFGDNKLFAHSAPQDQSNLTLCEDEDLIDLASHESNDVSVNSFQTPVNTRGKNLLHSETPMSVKTPFTPVTSNLLDSRYLREPGSTATFTTSESEVESTPFSVWKTKSVEPTYDFLNGAVEIPNELTCSDEETETDSTMVPVGNLLDLSIALNGGNTTPVLVPQLTTSVQSTKSTNQDFVGELINFSPLSSN